MRLLNSLFLMGILFLSPSSRAVEEPVCPLSHLQADMSLNIPCVEAAGQHYRINLEFVPPPPGSQQFNWRLNHGPALPECGRNFATCAIADENLNLSLPLHLEGRQHRVELVFNPGQDGQLNWTYQYHQPDAIELKEIRPNQNGGLEKLFAFQGDFTKSADMPLRLDEGVTLPASGLNPGETRTLRIFHFNDFHNELRSPHKSRGDTHRLSQMVKIVELARENADDNEIILFVSAGDDHIGNPLDELLGTDLDSFQTSGAYRAYSAAGVDMAVVGNHELDRGAKIFDKALDEAAFPVLSANLYNSRELNPKKLFPATLGLAKGLRIGFIGLTTPQETLLRPKDDPLLDAADIRISLENALKFVEPHADVIILLSHVGYNGPVDGYVRHELPVGDMQLAELAGHFTDKPVVLVGGHTHTALNADELEVVVNGVPILQTGGKGSQLGEASLSLMHDGNGLTMQAQARLHGIKKRDNRVQPGDPDYDQYEHDHDYDQVFERYVVEPLYAMLADRLNEIIGMAGGTPDLSTARTHADRYVGETLIANFMNDAIVAQSASFPPGPDGEPQTVHLAAFNASGVNGGVEPGQAISFNDWYGVMPFADIIMITEMSGAQIKQMVMNNARRVARPEELTPHGGQIDPSGYLSRGFLHFSRELRYTIRLGADATQTRAENITLMGRPIDDMLDQRFRVAFGDYIANGGEGWKGESVGAGLPDSIVGFDLKALDFHDTGLIYRNEIVDYIRRHGEVSAATGALKDDRIQVMP